MFDKPTIFEMLENSELLKEVKLYGIIIKI